MERAKKIEEVEDEVIKKEEMKFTKEQIFEFYEYRGNRDLVNAVLDDDKEYSLDEADSLIKRYLKKEVR